MINKILFIFHKNYTSNGSYNNPRPPRPRSKMSPHENLTTKNHEILLKHLKFPKRQKAPDKCRDFKNSCSRNHDHSSHDFVDFHRFSPSWYNVKRLYRLTWSRLHVWSPKWHVGCRPRICPGQWSRSSRIARIYRLIRFRLHVWSPKWHVGCRPGICPRQRIRTVRLNRIAWSYRLVWGRHEIIVICQSRSRNPRKNDYESDFFDRHSSVS